MNYRITKYNPELRNEDGCFAADEWTSVSDIGKEFCNGVFTKEEYQKTEDSYVNAISEILKEKGISELIVRDLEKDEKTEFGLSFEEKQLFEEITNNEHINLYKAEPLIRLVLREMLWCRLCSDLEDVKIEFGYDYYMYVSCSEIEASTKKKICESGLFVELML